MELEYIYFSNGLIYVGNEAFRVCWNLSKISLPNSLIEIGKEAFALCELGDISISDKVVFIGQGAFIGNFFDNEKLQNKLEYLFGEDIFL